MRNPAPRMPAASDTTINPPWPDSGIRRAVLGRVLPAGHSSGSLIAGLGRLRAVKILDTLDLPMCVAFPIWPETAFVVVSMTRAGCLRVAPVG